VAKKNVSHKEVLSSPTGECSGPLSEHVRTLEKVAQRSTVGLVALLKLSSALAIGLPTKSASTRILFICNMLQFEKSTGMTPSLISKSTTMGWNLMNGTWRERSAKQLFSVTQTPILI
jgi:hypothetical protein